MSFFESDGVLYWTDAGGSRVVVSGNTRPALLLPERRKTLEDFEIAWPDLAKANAYGYNKVDANGFDRSVAASYITIRPQEWDSGQSASIATIPDDCNYFQVDINLTRVKAPSQMLGETIPTIIRTGRRQTLDGGSAIAERIGPLVRMFRFERNGNTIRLRRKQSVTDAGERFDWNPNNSPTFDGGGQRSGWTWGGSGQYAHAASLRDTVTGGNCNRGQSNQATTSDNTDYSSIWRGTVIITPGLVK